MLCNMLPLLPELTKALNQIKQPAPSSPPSRVHLLDFGISASSAKQMGWVRKATHQVVDTSEGGHDTSEGEFCIFSCLQNCCFMVKWKASLPSTQGAWLLASVMGAWVGAWAGVGKPPQYHQQPCTVTSYHCCTLQMPFPCYKREDASAFSVFIALHWSKTACGYLQLLADYFTTSKECKEKQLSISGLNYHWREAQAVWQDRMRAVL